MSKNIHDTWKESRIKVFIRTTIITVISVAVFFSLGYLLDKILGSYPTGSIIGLVIAFPATQFIVYKQTKKYSKTQLKK